jgi:hypothetical protein
MLIDIQRWNGTGATMTIWLKQHPAESTTSTFMWHSGVGIFFKKGKKKLLLRWFY